MTDYNDGKWHGWNGGECPVHPRTVIKAVEEHGTRWEAYADLNDWASFRGAFRVVKVHREPLTLWVNEYPKGQRAAHENKRDADREATPNRIRCVKMVEVSE